MCVISVPNEDDLNTISTDVERLISFLHVSLLKLSVYNRHLKGASFLIAPN